MFTDKEKANFRTNVRETMVVKFRGPIADVLTAASLALVVVQCCLG